MKRGWKILIAIGLIMIAGLLVSIVHHYRLRGATEAYIAELKAQGEPMDLAQVMPPSVPPDQNGADTFRKAAALFKADQSLLSTNVYNSMRMVAPGKAMVCFQQPAAVDYDVTNTWEELAGAVAGNKDSFELLDQIVDRPTLDFGIHYEKGVWNLDFTNLYLSEVKQAALRLHVAGLSDLHRGDGASAAKDVRSMLALVKGMREERLVISELVRIAIANIALPVNWELLQSTNVTDEQLAALQNDWASLEFIRAEENALELERAAGRITVQKWRSSNAELGHYFQLDQPEIPWATWPKPSALNRFRLMSRIIRWRYWWSYPDELRALEGYQALLEAPRADQTNHALLSIQNDLKSKVTKLSIPADSGEYFGLSDPMKADTHFLLSGSVLTLEKTFPRIVKAETASQLTIGAIALKRYHMKHGEYPASLVMLVPEFVAKVPRDPIDGQPLRYRPNPDGTFLLYSIGDDGKDDGGDPASSDPNKTSLWWQSGRDWVWPQPATREEIQNYYDNPPK